MILKLTSRFLAAACFLFVISFISCSDAYHIKTDEEKEKEMALANKIKSVTEYRTAVLLGMEQQEQPSQIRIYNNTGERLKETGYKLDGTVDCTISYEYDEAGHLILSAAVTPGGGFMYKETRSYTPQGKRNELYFYLPDGTYKYRNVPSYDSHGRMTELAWYWPSGFRSKNEYEYDGARKTEDTEVDSLGNYRYRWIHTYRGGNLIKSVQYYPGNVINGMVVYEYNKDNQLTKQTNYFGESVQNSVSFEYDHKGLLSAKSEYNATGRLMAKYRYAYGYF